MKHAFAAAVVCTIFASIRGMPASAQAGGATHHGPPANAARLRWWRDARFGMFIHWGPVSLKGTEIGWSRGNQVPIDEYDSLYKRFNPVKFDADQWVEIAKAAGMKYIVLTTKHHDGFCLFDTKQTDYNIMNSPFHRDVVKELAAACRRHGLAFGTYYSVVDWHHPDHPHGSPGGTTLKPHPNLDRYEGYLKSQVAELIHNYGPLLVLWFDVAQDFDAVRGARVVAWTRSLQPDILVNNRCANPGDFDTPEQTIGHMQTSRPWESCITICNQWAYKPGDEMKPLKQCLQTLVRCAGGDGNLLFNVGPTPAGEIEPRQVKRLAEMGQWLRKYGRSIYGTRGGPYRPGAWGCSTFRGNRVYLHLMDWQGDAVTLPPLPRHVLAARTLTGGRVTVRQTAEALEVTLPKSDHDPIDTLVELRLDRPADGLRPLSTGGSLASGKPARASNVYANEEAYSADKAVDDDESSRWATDGGTHSAWLEVDLGRPAQIGRVRVVQEAEYAARIRKFEMQVKTETGWATILDGTTMPPEYVREFPPVTARVVRLNILEATDGPTIDEFQLFGPQKQP
jgi:alpha-L-fucosidase